MSDLLFQPMPQTEAEYVATIKQLFVEMQQLNEKMQHDQADIDRLKADSERLKVEGKRLDDEARVRLNRLNTALDQLGGTH